MYKDIYCLVPEKILCLIGLLTRTHQATHQVNLLRNRLGSTRSGHLAQAPEETVQGQLCRLHHRLLRGLTCCGDKSYVPQGVDIGFDLWDGSASAQGNCFHQELVPEPQFDSLIIWSQLKR